MSSVTSLLYFAVSATGPKGPNADISLGSADPVLGGRLETGSWNVIGMNY